MCGGKNDAFLHEMLGEGAVRQDWKELGREREAKVNLLINPD